MSVLTTDLRNHLALVTGASGGIGKATCRALASMGCPIAVHYHSSTEAAEKLVEELRSKGVKAESFKADLTDYEQVRSLHADVTKTMGHPTILFNNAGLALKTGIKSITEISIEEFEYTWKANCGSSFLMTQLSSKSALHGLVHWLAGAYSKAGITVNGIAPALIKDTAMLPGNEEELAKKIPVGRLGFPEEIAETVVWMVKTGYVTNKVIGVDGGFFVQ